MPKDTSRVPAEVDADSDPISVAMAATDTPADSEPELAASVDSLPALNKVDGEFLPPSLTLVAPVATDAPVVPETQPTTDDTVDDEAVAATKVEADEAATEPEAVVVDEPEAESVTEPEAVVVDEPEAESVDEPEATVVETEPRGGTGRRR